MTKNTNSIVNNKKSMSNLKSLKNMVLGFFLIFVIFSNIAVARTNFNVKFLEYDTDVGYPRYLVTIQTSEEGHLTYLENYYSIDSHGEKKFYSSKVFYRGNITTGNMTLETYRPKSRSGATFSLIEMVLRINNDTVLTKWRDLHKTKRWGYVSTPKPITAKSANVSDTDIDMKLLSSDISEMNQLYRDISEIRRDVAEGKNISYVIIDTDKNLAAIPDKRDVVGFDIMMMIMFGIFITIMVIWSVKRKKDK